MARELHACARIGAGPSQDLKVGRSLHDQVSVARAGRRPIAGGAIPINRRARTRPQPRDPRPRKAPRLRRGCCPDNVAPAPGARAQPEPTVRWTSPRKSFGRPEAYWPVSWRVPHPPSYDGMGEGFNGALSYSVNGNYPKRRRHRFTPRLPARRADDPPLIQSGTCRYRTSRAPADRETTIDFAPPDRTCTNSGIAAFYTKLSKVNYKQGNYAGFRGSIQARADPRGIGRRGPAGDHRTVAAGQPFGHGYLMSGGPSLGGDPGDRSLSGPGRRFDRRQFFNGITAGRGRTRGLFVPVAGGAVRLAGAAIRPPP